MKGRQTMPGLAIEATVTILLMGMVPVIIRHTTANVWTIGLVRLGVGAAGLGLLLSAARRWVMPSSREWRLLLLIGALFGTHWTLYFSSIKVASAGIAVIGQSTFGIHLVVLGWIIGHHQVRRTDLVAVALAVVGSFLVAPQWTLENRATVGLLLGITSAFCYAFLPILHQRASRLPSSVRAFWQFAVALPIFLAFLPRADFHLPTVDWFWLAILGFVCTLVQHTLWTRITTRLSTLTTSLLFYMAVPVTLVLAVWLLDERVTARMLTGAALIVAGNLLGIGDQWRAGRIERVGAGEGGA
jgi:drug/metabolite transporter (DMT)-like permease